MKRLFLILFIGLSIHAQAQKGIELKLGPGFGFFGNDEIWFKSALVSFTALYNFNGVIAVGPTYSIGLGGKTYYLNNTTYSETSFSEFGGIIQFTFLRVSKFKFYGNVSVAQIKGKTETVEDQNGNVYLGTEDSSVGFGGGVGIVLNIGNGFYFNILEYQLRSIKTDYLNMDAGFQGSAGSLNALRTAISYTFQGK
jgi:hypothetical protein